MTGAAVVMVWLSFNVAVALTLSFIKKPDEEDDFDYDHACGWLGLHSNHHPVSYHHGA